MTFHCQQNNCIIVALASVKAKNACEPLLVLRISDEY